MGQPRHVFFATIAAGGGHVATATALAEALHAYYPDDFTTRVSDVMAEFGAAALDRRHKASWRALLRRPQLVRIGQRLSDAAPCVTRLSQSLTLDAFARSLARQLNELGPDLVVANHGWLATVFAAARTRYGLRAPVVIYATEPFDASALWSEPRSELVFAPSVAAREDLVRLGVRPERVHVVGYPVRQPFLAPPARAAARAELGLAEPGFTTLLTLGAEGLAGEAVAMAEQILSTGSRLLAVAGRNAELKARFDNLAAEHPGLTAFGFTDRMPTLLAAADLVVGKAGPASTMEALAVGRPLLVTAYAGLNEAAVVRFLEERELGGITSTVDLAAAVAAWRDAPARLAAASVHAAALDFPGMARRAAAHVRSVACGEALPTQPPLADLPFERVTRALITGRPGAKAVRQGA
ncbi:MAG TPA: glycosyltransferase [Trueperaceae bacterium]|nr:glycosyltransferase [Trueperaceae bacterium]